MEIRDPVHGSIHILEQEIPIIKNNFFQRLRNIKQLGFSEYIFPGATHTRFLHSIGVMCIGHRVFDSLFKDRSMTPELSRLKETFKLACLLHDIGHAPLSHASEMAMPPLEELKIPKQFLNQKDILQSRKATHEDYTLKSIADSSFAHSFQRVEQDFGVERSSLIDLIRGSTDHPQYFTLEGVNYFPILHQLVSSELDCDRMDYLLRDSYFCGVSYGSFDLDWMIDNLNICVENEKAFLGINERAIITFDDFLLSRYHMFVMVYFHYRAVCLEQLLYRYFETSPHEYKIPSDIEQYVEHDDYHLMKALRHSQNPYAQAIVKNQIPNKIYESFNHHQYAKLKEIKSYLEQHNIDYIQSSSSSRLSKYSNESGVPQHKYPIKVVRKFYQNKTQQFFDINQATELFQKFSKSHEINRIYCEIDSLDQEIKQKLKDLLQT